MIIHFLVFAAIWLQESLECVQMLDDVPVCCVVCGVSACLSVCLTMLELQQVV